MSRGDTRLSWEMYADESASETGRFESFAVVSGPSTELDDLRDRAEEASEDWDEAKFTKVDGYQRNSRVAAAFVEIAIEKAHTTSIRVDVIVWDTHDQRHAVPGRDDAANFGRMAYHLLTNTVRRQRQSGWVFRPDAGANVDWTEVVEFLNNTRVEGPRRTRPQPTDLFGSTSPFITPSSFEPLASDSERLVQVADLFAGMACFSREEAPGCACFHEHEWHPGGRCVYSLPFDEVEEAQLSNRKRAKYELICRAYDCCKARTLGVSLASSGYLKTADGRNSVNFWQYEPQHGDDTAPTRSG